jgi:hypothetical protein
VGCHSLESVDYPDYADVSLLVATACAGTLICGTGTASPLPPTGTEDLCRQLS